MATEVAGVMVTQPELVSLFTGLGKASAKDWSSKRLKERIKTIPELAEAHPDKVEKLSSNDKEVLEAIKEAVAGGADIELEVGEEPAPKKAKKKDKEKTKAKAAAKPEKKDKKKGGSRGNLEPAGGNGKPGVLDTIIECLKTASKSNPIDRDGIVKVLKKRFPDRDEKGMRVTVVSQVPLRISRRGLDVQNNSNGFWIRRGVKKAD